MKIKYRRFDDVDYTEVEVYDFIYTLKLNTKPILELFFGSNGKTGKVIENVCEVYIEEI